MGLLTRHVQLLQLKMNLIERTSQPLLLPTALRNHMRIVFEEMSSWTPLKMYLGMKTTF